MKEIIFYYPTQKPADLHNMSIKWLQSTELDIFNRHLADCGQMPMEKDVWAEIEQEGNVYCGLFVDQKMVARACVEKYSEEKWEVADVRTVKDYRNRGYAREVCAFVLNEILLQKRIPTIRTREDNHAMLKVIRELGFVPL